MGDNIFKLNTDSLKNGIDTVKICNIQFNKTQINNGLFVNVLDENIDSVFDFKLNEWKNWQKVIVIKAIVFAVLIGLSKVFLFKKKPIIKTKNVIIPIVNPWNSIDKPKPLLKNYSHKLDDHIL